MKTALLSAILALCFAVLGVQGVRGAEVPKAVAAVPALSVAIEAIANLADPEKLATLGVRGANPRVQKITYWLFVVRQNGGRPQRQSRSVLRVLKLSEVQGNHSDCMNGHGHRRRGEAVYQPRTAGDPRRPHAEGAPEYSGRQDGKAVERRVQTGSRLPCRTL
jgi:hypothetical protein